MGNDILAPKRPPIERLKEIMARLRAGCPWDKEQTHASLRKYVLEEAYEVVEAIDRKNMNNLQEELGDLLLQVVFHARIAEEEGAFTLDDVIEGIANKLIRRHPHVFADQTVGSSEDVKAVWEQIKLQEKGKDSPPETTREYIRVPKELPALMLAEASQRKAAQWGFDWPDYQGPLAKVYEELAEWEQALAYGSECDRSEEMGDILFSLVNVSRFLNIDSEICLRRSTLKFQERFTQMMKKIERSEKNIANMSLKEMDEVWNSIKSE